MRRLGATLTVAAIAALAAAPPVSADEIRDDQWYLKYLQVETAHHDGQGEGIVVAVIDTGVDATHADLSGNVLPGTDIVAGGSGDGRMDADGHGTAMASLIAGHGHGNGAGILGLAPRAKILPVRTSTPTMVERATDTAHGIEWAIDHGAKVICVASTGGSSPALLQATQRAQRSNVIVVAGAGNRPKDLGIGTPASYPGVVAAAMVDRNGNHHPNSVTGPELVLAAPGADVVAATKNGGYSHRTGTSDATAIISGAAALVRAKYPDLPAEEVIHRLTATATDKGPPGRDEEYGYGVLNLVAALTADVPPLHPASPTTSARPTSAAAAPSAPPKSTSGTMLAFVLGLLAVVAVGGLVVVGRASRNRGE